MPFSPVNNNMTQFNSIPSYNFITSYQLFDVSNDLRKIFFYHVLNFLFIYLFSHLFCDSRRKKRSPPPARTNYSKPQYKYN